MSRRRLSWMVVLAAGLAYPLAVLAGGSPSFPTRAECVHPARADGDLEGVFGRLDAVTPAESLRDRALEVGFRGTGLSQDGCGRIKVAVRGIPTLKVGAQVIAEAHTVDLHPILEQVTP